MGFGGHEELLLIYYLLLIIDYLPFTNLGRLALSPCCAAAYDMHTEMLPSPAGGLCLPSGKHTGILTYFLTIVNKKMTKKQLFLARPLTSEITNIHLTYTSHRGRHLWAASYFTLLNIEILSWPSLGPAYKQNHGRKVEANSMHNQKLTISTPRVERIYHRNFNLYFLTPLVVTALSCYKFPLLLSGCNHILVCSKDSYS